MAELLKGMGLEKLADESALKRLEEDSKAGLADTFKDEAKRKAYFTNWGDDGRSTPPPIRWRNKNGDEREIEPQINDIISNPDALEHFMEYSKNMPDDKKTEAYEKILREADKSLISTIKNASDLETLKRLMKLTTPEQRTTLLEEKKD
ncbi:MAG: hypothetical protein LBD75_00290 [Candidatus Peribacteria bacterium]|jgi:hypothetical protein|nr:hypothetical protein [Candidatus Peribacteria bacterium]